MAVSKLWAVNSRLGQVIDYAANPEKTAADIYTEEQYQALADVLSYAKDEEKPNENISWKVSTVIRPLPVTNLFQSSRHMGKRTAYKPITDI